MPKNSAEAPISYSSAPETTAPKRYLVTISGSGPASGASTQAKELQEAFGFEIISGGKIRRAMAVHWDMFKRSMLPDQQFIALDEKDYTKQEEEQKHIEPVWNNFKELYRDAYSAFFADKNDSLLHTLIDPHLKKDCSGDMLESFNLQQNRDKDVFWTVIPDIMMYSQLLQTQPGQGAIVDAKLATLIDGLFGELPSDFQTVHLLFDTTEAISSWRALRRELELKFLDFPDTLTTFEDLEALKENPNFAPHILSPAAQTKWNRRTRQWLQSQLKRLKQQNRDRIRFDLETYQAAYADKPLKTFLYETRWDTFGNAHKIDVEQDQESVALYILGILHQVWAEDLFSPDHQVDNYE